MISLLLVTEGSSCSTMTCSLARSGVRGNWLRGAETIGAAIDTDTVHGDGPEHSSVGADEIFGPRT